MLCFARKRKRRQAFTILEVVVGTTLLASLVVSVLIAISSHQKKVRVAQQRIVATRLADELLSRWMQSTDGVPLSARGTLLPDQTRMVSQAITWQTNVIDRRELCGIPVHVVRLSLTGHARDKPGRVLCSVDVVVDIDPGAVAR
ncbi:MAG: type II secretion system protein [Pirellulaceae bacterium]|nr:type II secretion system protein [Pirellulaceae bacterium]